MQVNLVGRVSNMRLPYSKALLPLFEAVVNAFQSIEDLDNKTNTYIKVFVNREPTQTRLTLPDGKNTEPITGFVVEDNGIGFNENNFSSFETSDSIFKQSKGGKGIGRLLWLKAFKKTEIRSVFVQDGKWFERKFDFILSPNGISDPKLKEIGQTERQTSVELKDFYPKFKDACPKKLDTIAQRIIEHCLSYFLLSDCPRVLLTDGYESIDLNQVFATQVKTNTQKECFTYKGADFQLTHLRLYSASEEHTHRIHFCANNREVESKNLSSLLPNLVRKVKDEEEKAFIYLAYLAGSYLDENVNAERTGFSFLDDNEIEFPDLITRPELERLALNRIKKYLYCFLEPINREKVKRVTEYISQSSPQYKPLLKHRLEAIEQIPPELPDDKLDLALYGIAQEFDLSIKKKSQEFLKGDINKVTDLQAYKRQYHDFLEQVNDIGKSNLAKYIIHRKLILDLLNNNLNTDDQNKYKPEESIHEIIFPMHNTSDDINYENQNLWVIDERLAYHNYLASDMPFTKMDILESDNLKRPDVLIFNQPIAFVED